MPGRRHDARRYRYRYLRGRVDALVVQMEKEAITLVEALSRKNYLDTIGQEQ